MGEGLGATTPGGGQPGHAVLAQECRLLRQRPRVPRKGMHPADCERQQPLWGLHAATAAPSRTAEVAVLLTANAAATLLRFVLFRGWVFRPRPMPTTTPDVPVLESTTAR